MVLAPVVRSRKGEYKDLFEHLRAEGFTRVQVDGELRRLEEDIALDKKYKHDISVVVDRLVMRPDLRKRLADSIETAVTLAEGMIDIQDAETGEVTTYSERFACLNCGTSMPELEPRMFSFNSPHGACPRCTGLGSQMEIDPDLVVPDPSLTLAEGAILPWSTSSADYYEQMTQAIADRYEVDMDTPWEELPDEVRDTFLYGTDGDRLYISYKNRFGRKRSYMATFEGIIPNLERRFNETDSDYVRDKIEEYMATVPCPECDGSRLRPESLAVRIGELGIHEVTRMSVKRAIEWFENLELTDTERQIARLVLREINERLRFLDNVGIGYLSLDRAAATLSGGEAQRIRLATQIGSSLVGVLYILDEPSIGLHQRDNERLIETLERLRDIGNTVIVVEHDEGTMRAADHIVDIGPGAGEHGGWVVAEGTPEEIMEFEESATGQFLSGTRVIEIPPKRRKPTGKITVEGASQNNLKKINVDFPLGVFCCVTGVSGSGKSTLVNEILYKALWKRLVDTRTLPGAHEGIDGIEHVHKVVNIDQAPIGRNSRSNPATYIGFYDSIRDLFTQAPLSVERDYKPGRFSFNVKGGRCEECQGEGVITTQLYFMPDVEVTCAACKGARFNSETLEVALRGKTIDEVLNMSVEEGVAFFASEPAIGRKIQVLADLGLGYLTLGQSATTLSGGEAQRIKIATELSTLQRSKHTVYILDEPTTGLHLADVERLLESLNRLVDAGHTVLLIEHHLDVIKTADYVIDLGPEGGHAGGEVVATGTPEDIARCRASYTGKFLKGHLKH
jgi:excinuclease ABC subunit A